MSDTSGDTIPQEPEVEGTPADIPTKEPDATLELTDEGIEMPEFLKGYIGEFTIRTANVTGDIETSDQGLPETDVWDGIIAEYPGEGDYHGDLREGLLAISTEEHRETVFEVVDNRTEDDV